MTDKRNSMVLAAALLLTTVFVVFFWPFFSSHSILLTTDATISSASTSFMTVAQYALPHWDSTSLLGEPRGMGTQAIYSLKLLLPPVLWNNLAYGLACLACALVFLRNSSRRLNSPWAAACGALIVCWLGQNFCLIYPGHGHKPFVILFFVCAVTSLRTNSLQTASIWGGFVGLMFAQQPDVALFFALFAGAHLIFRLWQHDGLNPIKWLPVLIPAALVSLLLAAGPLLSGYTQNVKNTAQVQTESPQEKWEYMTQWSWPPEETISFIAPGYTGWKTGDPEGPYYGRMGRSAGWEQTGQGYMNFQLDSLYLGFIPIAFALFAVFAARRSPFRPEIWFWGVSATIALLLAFGKNFPLYALFYKFPVVNNIRNPVKFIQIFQVAIGILTAYGIDALLNCREKSTAPDRQATIRQFFWILVGASTLLLLWTLAKTSSQTSSISAFNMRGWPAEAARVIVDNQIRALWHASLMAAVTLAAFAVFVFRPFARLREKTNWIGFALAVVIAADAWLLSRHYLETMPRSYIEENDLTRFLKSNLGHQRVALLTQQGLYNIWLTYLLPYNHIPTFNFPQMPRMPVDYKNFLTAGSKDPLRMWSFSSVKYLLGPTAFEKQLPPGITRRVFTYSLEPAPNNEFYLIPNPRGDHAVYELLTSIPRYALVAGMVPESDDQALARLGDSRAPLIPEQGITGKVEVVSYRPGKVKLATESDIVATLRVAERWDPDWKAKVDGKPAEVQRADYLIQGVTLPPGKHEVILLYSPSKVFFYMQLAGLCILLVAAFWRRNTGN